jgi:hypothetical protein
MMLRWFSAKRAALLVAVLAPAAEAWALGIWAIKPVTEVKDAKPIWQWVATVLMVVVCAAIVFKNAKRSHQN